MLRGTIAITLLNLAAIPRRLGSSLVIVIGIAGVVGVLISVLAMAQGFLDTLGQTGRPDRAIVLRGGSQSELASTLSRDNAQAIADAPGVKVDAGGHAVQSSELVAIIDLPLRQGGTSANVTLRGVGPQAGELRPELHLLAGRMFKPGLREVIVGKGAQLQFAGADLGSHIALRDSDWTVVGIFDSNDGHSSEVLADVDSALAALRRNLFQSVTVMLQDEAAFDRFHDALTSDPRLNVEVLRETDYYARLSAPLGKLLTFVGYVVGGIMAVGALFGALNTMYSAVSARTLEIATLRAIGFGGGPILISVFVEALLLSLIGAVLGSAMAWLLYNGNAVNTLGGNFTQVVFHLTVTPKLMLLGIVWAAVIGLLGGLFPALRAARRPVVEALRATG
jgi:putative ABC transport system permease protein